MAAIEDTADVLILDCQYSDQGWKDCTDLIDLYATTSPIALITADVSTEPMANRQPISCVTEPITRSKIQETVERLYIEDIYSELIDHYFSLATRRAELETAQSQRTLREDPEYQMLLTDLCNLRRYADHRVEDILDRFDRRVFETI
ncbi:MAG: HalX domain-containing protein [Halobacteriales archaeon]